MRKSWFNNPLPPFPKDISKEMFGAHISGFVSGEGCFCLYLIPKPKRKSKTGHKSPAAELLIRLRSDDIEILKLIRSYFQCGNVRVSTNGKVAVWAVSKIRQLVDIIIPHFEKFPMFAKKQRDFLIWKQAVTMMGQINLRKQTNLDGHKSSRTKWTKQEHEKFREMKNSLHAIRKFLSEEELAA